MAEKNVPAGKSAVKKSVPVRKSTPAKPSAARPVPDKKAPVRTSVPKTDAFAEAAPREIGMPVLMLFAVLFLICAFVYQYILPSGEAEGTMPMPFIESYDVRINEVMSANSSAFTSDTGKYSDWLEIHNAGKDAVNLRGWTLAKESDAIHPLTFPDLILGAGEYLIVYADGKAQTAPGYAIHAPYKLTAAGDSLVLMDSMGTVADSVNVPSLEKNECYARTSKDAWEVTRQYTPMLPNTAESYAAILEYRPMPEDAVEISEVMIKNRTYAPDEDGDYSDYVELHNTSAKPVSLQGYALSDNEGNPTKWVLPDVTLPADGYMLVYTSGKNRTSGYALHAGFKLSEDESIFLTNPKGLLVDSATPETTEADQAWSKTEMGFTAQLAPTPRYANNASGIAAVDAELTGGNMYGLFISEVMTSTNETDLSSSSPDWVEIYNGSAGTLDLSGIALSDDANRPRKWQFPQGATIRSGEYMIVFLTGEDTTEGGTYCASFRLSKDGGYSLLLSTPEGKLIDRLPVSEQYANISYGRSYSVSGLRYYTTPTPRAANNSVGCAGRAQEPVFSVEGGLFEAGERLTVSMSVPAGHTIYYTTDCTDPDQGSAVYTKPLTIDSNTIIRTLVCADDKLPSIVTTQSYFFGMDHTVRVVSLVSDPVNLFDYHQGIYEKGPGAVGQYAEHPYGSNGKGANFWMDWEKFANVEVFETDGSTLISQGCGLKLQGQFSRAEAQKSFKLIARSEYGSNRFHASIFDDRPYTEYQSFVLRASGQDWDKTRMRDIVQTSLAAETDVMYQAAEMCVVYINGQYWGHYNMRERINDYSICQWEGWTSEPDDLDLIKANRTVMQGSNDSFEEIVTWITEHGVKTQADIDYVSQYIDIENYLDYVAVQIYIGNPDLLNVKRYRSVNEDGKWRWVLFDTDWGFYTDTNSMRRWLDPKGAGSEYKTDNRLFVGLMKNEQIKDWFLHRFDELMVKSWTSDKVLATIDYYYDILAPEIDEHLARWEISRSKYDTETANLVEYAEERPLKMLYYVMTTYEMNETEMMNYFSDSLAVVVPQALDDITAKLEAAGLSKYLKEWRMDEAEYEAALAKLYSYAEEHPVKLMKAIYAVYEPNNGPRNALTKFEDVLEIP